MFRLDNLDENRLDSVVTDLERQFNEIKTSQFVGSDSAITNRVFSAAAYDVEAINVGLAGVTIEVTYNPTDTVFQDLGLAYKMVYVPTISPDATVTLVGINVERQKPIGQQQKWLIFINYASGGDPVDYVRLKFYFFTNGSGSFAATLV